MRRQLVIIAAALALGGCNTGATPVAAYQSVGDQLKAMTGGVFGIPCGVEETIDGAEVIGLKSAAECYTFGASLRFRGVWLDDFEGSAFLDGIDVAPSIIEANQRASWLEIDQKLRDRFPRRPAASRTYRLEFIGRKTKYSGRYGHMGGSNNLIVLDRILSVTPIKGPRGYHICSRRNCKLYPR